MVALPTAEGVFYLDIQWYPGHMAKAKRLLSAQLAKVDLVVELCDARLPLSSRNPALDELIRRKRRVLLLCKADLAEQAKTQAWLAYFKRQGTEVMAYDKSPQKTKQARQLIEVAAQDVLERNRRRGIQKTLRAMVVGVPNVGKSTFINRLYGGSIAKTGMLWPKLNDQRAATRLAYIGTIRDAVYDQYELCVNLLEDLLSVMPQRTMERYKIKDAELRGYPLLEEVCRGRGFLMRGGVCDLDRACAVILDEFREGKVGKITLEEAPKPEKEDGHAKAL